MVLNRKPTGTAMSLPGGIGIGTGIAMVITIAGTATAVGMIDSGSIAESGIGYAAMAVLLVSSLCASWSATALVKRQRLAVSLITGGIYFLLLLGITAFCFGGQYQGVIPTALLVLGGSSAGTMLANMGQGNRTPRRHKYRTG